MYFDENMRSNRLRRSTLQTKLKSSPWKRLLCDNWLRKTAEMLPNTLQLCLLTLQITALVCAREFSGKRRTKDVFEASNDEQSRKHQRRFIRSTFKEVKIPLNGHRTRRSNSDLDKVNKVCTDPAAGKFRNIINDKWDFSNNTHFSISMSWVGKDHKTILLLATSEILVFVVQHSLLYKSIDFGKTFKKINSDIFEGHIRKNFGIQKSPVDPNMVILVSFGLPIFSIRGSILYITKDGANSWVQSRAPFQLAGAIEFHPRNKNWILARSTRLSQGAYLSKDFGHSWTRLRPNVLSVKWGAQLDKKVPREEQTILLTAAPVLHGQINIYDLELWRSRNLGQRFELLVKHCYSFGIQGPFLFVSVDFNKSNMTRIMHVSSDGGDTFDTAQVPSITPERFYSILDMSEGMVFLHVDDKGDTGKGVLYTSDADGIVFDESLDNHLYTNYDEVTDFYKIESMNGAYITSRMNSDRSLSTVITFDRGGEWNPIPLDKDTFCEHTVFLKGETCSLHIHGRFSQSRGVAVPQGPLSEANAVGVIIAHANPGNALTSKNIGIWVSRDGGFSWKKAPPLDGPHHYSIGDHGNLIVAIPTKITSSNYLWYSVNEGTCWFKYEFTQDPMVFTGLVTAPGATTMSFSIWGYTMPKRIWRVITLDFRKILQRKCMYNVDPAKSDYITWQPHGAGKTKTGCLLGKKVTILRPKPDKLCFNGEDYVRQSTIEYCPCTMADLECDYGYYRKPGQTTCKRNQKKKPRFCLKGELEIVNDRGYRRIPGDVCKKGLTDVEKYVDAHQQCTNASYYSYGMEMIQDTQTKTSGKSNVVAVIVPIVILLALAACLYFAKTYWDIRKAKPAYQYSTVPSEEEPRNDDHDMFDPRPKGLRPYHDSDDDATMIEI